MDGICMPHPPRPKGTAANSERNKPCDKKYHIEFGAAKCKVAKIGKGPKSNILLNNQVMMEVETYKHLGEVFNNKGNMEAHIKAIEGKIHAATQNIITETGNEEFKGMKMQAMWQIEEATIIPVLTYGAVGCALTQKEQQLHSVFNKSLKNILALPMTAPNNILISETGLLPIKYLINKKKITQAHILENKIGTWQRDSQKKPAASGEKKTRKNETISPQGRALKHEQRNAEENTGPDKATAILERDAKRSTRKTHDETLARHETPTRS